MEKRWDEPKPLTLQMIAAGTAVAMAALLLAAVGFGEGGFAREVGVLIGEAVAAVVRSVFSALGGLIVGNGQQELRLPLFISPFW